MNEQDTRMGNEKIGSIALTGLGVSAPLILIISAFSMFVGGGGAPLAAIALGKNDKEEAEKIFRYWCCNINCYIYFVNGNSIYF